MMNEPCARLMMFMIPQTREKPSATTAKIPPARIPFTRSWATRCIACPRLSLPPRRRRINGLHRRQAARPNRQQTPLLDLVDDHWLVHVQAAAVELDDAVERRDVELRQRVAHLLGIERARAFERVLERQACRRRLRV